MTERKKFEIVFRNMRAEYKGHAVSSEIDNLADLKKFGRRLDATYWYKYQPSNTESNTRGKQTSQVNEIQTGAKPKQKSKQDNEEYKTRNFYNSKTRANESGDENKPSRKEPQGKHSKNQEGESGLKSLLQTYQIPKDNMCFNCRLKGHHARDCEQPRHKYCQGADIV